jgi:formylglycine-generating enzyme required for sulfatase activity
MMRRFIPCVNRLAISVFLGAILAGCSANMAAPAPPNPAIPAIQASLTAAATPVTMSKANSPETALQKDQTVAMGVNDGVVVPESGHGVMRFGDRLTVDILRSAELKLTDVKVEPGDSLFVILKQVKGHSRVSLSDNANARVRLETDIATLTTLKAGTEFMVCQAPDKLTCMVVIKGEVEVAGQNKVVTVKGGEGTYILKDKPPFPPICAHLDQLNTWFDKKLGSGNVQALSELVSSWKQESCAALAAEALTPTASGYAVSATPGVTQSLPKADGMVKIDAGTYHVGSATADDAHVPTLSKDLPAFWIDAYPVTNADYKRFMDATGHAAPLTWPGPEKHPVTGVNWSDATSYCAWANKRLPTEAEWEVAARGPGADPPLYPWGNDPMAGGKVDDLPLTDTYDVGTFSFNKSPFGVFDMSGTVWQWVSDPYYPVPEGTRVLRGGRHGFIQDMAYRQPVQPDNARFVAFAGFRCAAGQVQGK